MITLTTDQLIYLFYAEVYSSGEGTVTKGTVKSSLPKVWKRKANQLFEDLKKKGLVKDKSKYRFELTEKGKEALITNLINTDYKFDSNKGPKVTNTLLKYVKEAANQSSPQFLSSQDMEFSDFQERFKIIFFEIRKSQSIKGVAVVRKQELFNSFLKEYPILRNKLEEYFQLLRSKGEVSVTEGRDDELIEWVE